MLRLYEENDIKAIADGIRAKNGTSNTYKVGEMAQTVESLFTVTENERTELIGLLNEITDENALQALMGTGVLIPSLTRPAHC